MLQRKKMLSGGLQSEGKEAENGLVTQERLHKKLPLIHPFRLVVVPPLAIKVQPLANRNLW